MSNNNPLPVLWVQLMLYRGRPRQWLNSFTNDRRLIPWREAKTLTNWLIDWLIDWLTDWLTDSNIIYNTERPFTMTDWLTGWLTDFNIIYNTERPYTTILPPSWYTTGEKDSVYIMNLNSFNWTLIHVHGNKALRCHMSVRRKSMTFTDEIQANESAKMTKAQI